MSLLHRLQRKTLIPAQIAGYALTLLVGVIIVLLAIQLYYDVKPLLTQQTDVFKGHAVTVSKNVTLFKTARKDAIYFDQRELAKLQEQEFVKSVAQFRSAAFSIFAYINLGDGHRMSSDLFFESVPDKYIDVESDAWKWDTASDFLPIIISQEYLQLYNFGFAQSQAMPVFSEATVEQISFNITIQGNGKRRDYVSRIVGFSGKINTILVPDNFLEWANQVYGNDASSSASVQSQAVSQPSRLLVEFNDASDERIPSFFENNGLSVNQNEMESSKLLFFFRLALLFVGFISVIIIILSVAFIVMSLNLIVQKNRDLFVNLYNIGYSEAHIARFYQRMVGMITVLDIVVALAVALAIRGAYIGRLSSMFTIGGGNGPLCFASLLLLVCLLVLYNLLIRRIIHKTVGQN